MPFKNVFDIAVDQNKMDDPVTVNGIVV